MQRNRSSWNERELVAGARAGDRVCFDVLFERNRQHVRRYLARRSPASELEDLLQECAIAAWRAMPTYEGRAAFKTWLISISRFKALDAARNANPRGIELETMVDRLTHSEAGFERFDLAETIRPHLERLDAPKQEILRLYYGSGFTLEEIAARLGRNPSTVKYHFYQAHATLAADLAAERPAAEISAERDGGRP